MKKALITGGSRGIGLAIAKELATAGMQVTLVSRSISSLESAVQQLNGGYHQVLCADLTEASDLANVTKHLVETHYDVLVNNAGYGLYGMLHTIPLSQQLHMVRLNCEVLLDLSYTYLKQSRAGDALINIASTLGHSTFPGAAAYAGTKGFVVRFSEAVWYEYKKQDVFVGVFCPGPTDTDFHEVAGGAKEDIPKAIRQTPEQVAKEFITFLRARRKPMGISGFQNRIMYFLQRFQSRKSVVNMMGTFARPMLKRKE